MSIVHIFLFIFIFLAELCITGDIFKCADEWKVNTCKYSRKITTQTAKYTEYYVKKCSKGKTCYTLTDNVSQCVKIKGLIKEGDSCKYDDECETGNCPNGKCAYIEQGKECFDNSQCDKSSYCKAEEAVIQNEEEEKNEEDEENEEENEKEEEESNKCSPLVDKEGKCDDNDNCKFGLLCNGKTSKCTEMFSLNDGAVSDEDLLCKSGTIVHINNTSFCATTKITNSTCVEDNETQRMKCEISYDDGTGSKTTKINCNTYDNCPLQSDSPQLKEFIKVYQEKAKNIKQKDIEDIHVSTTNRYVLDKNKDVVKAYVNYKYYSEIGDNKDSNCIRDYFVRFEESNSYITMSFTIFAMIMMIVF